MQKSAEKITIDLRLLNPRSSAGNALGFLSESEQDSMTVYKSFNGTCILNISGGLTNFII